MGWGGEDAHHPTPTHLRQPRRTTAPPRKRASCGTSPRFVATSFRVTALLLCRVGDDAGLAHVIVGGRCLIGRALACDVRPGGQVSRRHALLTEAPDGRLLVEDLGSKNGTFLNGRRLTGSEAATVAHLDTIALGDEAQYVLFELERVPATEVVAAALVGPDGARAGLQLGDNVLGSDESCDLVVTLPGVMPQHARLELTTQGVTIEPLDGPVMVNAKPRRGRLVDGDLLRLGAHAEFEVEAVGGLAALPRTLPAASPTSPSIQPTETPPDDKPEAPKRTAPTTAPADEHVAHADEPRVRERETTTASAADVEASRLRARERHERYVAFKALQAAGGVGIGTTGGTGSGEIGQRTLSRRLPPTPMGAPRREAAARIHLRVPGSRDEIVTLLREGRHVVGRHDDCRVRVLDLSVSREHAEVRVSPQGIRIKDLDSANGTWVGMERVTEAVVEPNARVRFGSVEAWFEEI